MTTTALKTCVCRIPRPRFTPGHERTCVVCGFHIPPEWDSARIEDNFARLALGFAAGPPESFARMRDLCTAREQDGRQHFGYAFHNVNLIREVREELADAMNYLGFYIIVCHKDGNEETADGVLNAMMSLYHAWEAIDRLGLE